DGPEFIRWFRARDKSTPIVMVTTEGEKPRVIQAIKAGVSGYLVKPFNREQLAARIQDFRRPRKVA
ncbi:MAG: response regulator, partial [Planctomycetota bacterium]